MRLAIDTSAHLCAACLYDTEQGKVIASETRDIGRGHAEMLMDVVASCFETASTDYSKLTSLAVTIGPGSFTGVRVGMAVARGLALSLKIPIAGISTLDACAEFAKATRKNQTLVTLIDARRGEAYCKIAGEAPFVASYEVLASYVPASNVLLCGTGAAVFNATHGTLHPIAHEEAVAPIEVIAAMNIEHSELPPEPLYLRNADAKPQAGFVLPRAGVQE